MFNSDCPEPKGTFARRRTGSKMACWLFELGDDETSGLARLFWLTTNVATTTPNLVLVPCDYCSIENLLIASSSSAGASCVLNFSRGAERPNYSPGGQRGVAETELVLEAPLRCSLDASGDSRPVP